MKPLIRAVLPALLAFAPLWALAQPQEKTALDELTKRLQEDPGARAEAGKSLEYFLLDPAEGKGFVDGDADRAALGAVARDWAGKAEVGKLAVLVLVATPRTPPESRLRQALSAWSGENRIKARQEKSAAAAFLFDAADKAAKVYADPRVRKDIDAGATTGEAVNERDRAAIERARKLREGTRVNSRAFGADRNPGGLNAGAGGSGTGGQAGGGAAGGSSPKPNGVGATAELIQAGGAKSGSSGGTAVAGPGAYLPAANVPANFKKPNVVPPLATVELTDSDRVINKALSVVNMESFSRKDTLNKESFEGTQATICRFLIKAKYDPGEAWSLALAARNAPGADPGDLDLRNAEHYLYAYSTTAKPGGWGDSTPVQLLMAVGWTPFKTVTKHVRPTSKPSLEEAKWGVKGAWHGQHPPDWRATCEPSSGRSA